MTSYKDTTRERTLTAGGRDRRGRALQITVDAFWIAARGPESPELAAQFCRGLDDFHIQAASPPELVPS